jgi:hypothetical protein
MGASGLAQHPAIRNDVGHDQRGREEEKAEKEVEEETVPLRAATRAGQKAIATLTMRNRNQ